MKITFFGTWSAVASNCDNTYFMIEHENKNLFVDAWGGRELQKMILRNEVPMPQNIFLTHCHTDHLLWLPHVFRVLREPVKLFLSQESLVKVNALMDIVWLSKKLEKLFDSKMLTYEIIEEWKEILINDWKIIPIDIHSKKVEQFWFNFVFGEKRIVFFWDEAIDIKTRSDLHLFQDPDVLICETFCLENQKELYKPHEKAHITAKETGEIVQLIHPKKAFITHYTEILWQSREEQAREIHQEVSQYCDCDVIVPLDGQSFEL